MELIFQKSSGTIRQMPENYIIARKTGSAWVCDPDLAADRTLVLQVFEIVITYKGRYGSGENLLDLVKNINTEKQLEVVLVRREDLDNKDHKFSKFLSDNGWEGEYDKLGNSNKYFANGKVIAVAFFNNSEISYTVWGKE